MMMRNCYYWHLNRLSTNLALLSDVSMAVLGGSLKRRDASLPAWVMLSQLCTGFCGT